MNDPLTYYSAHAPDAPAWFEKKTWQTKEVEPLRHEPGRVHHVVKTHTESHMDYLVRWRMTYATAMIEALAKYRTT